VTLKVELPCNANTLTRFAESFSLSLTKSNNDYLYVLKRTDITLDDGNVYSTAAANTALFTTSADSCEVSEIKLFLDSDTQNPYTGSDVMLQNPTDLSTANLKIHRKNPFTKDFVLRGFAPTAKV
jgi:hypothetical protein